MNNGCGKLVVLACSARKRLGHARLAATLYNGSAYRVAGRNNVKHAPLLILSAEHGLLSPYDVVSPYDRRMDAERADELCMPGAVRKARELVQRTGAPFQQVFCHGGSLYREVLEEYQLAGVFGTANVQYSHGRIGEQLAQLVKFLRE